MKKEDLKIVFLGNPEFAQYHLEKILSEGYRVVAVISAPDKASGRGLKVHSSAVTQFARSEGIPVLQPSNLKSLDFIEELRSLKADIQVVIAFRMLPEVVWNMPPLGTINLHASLLPQYRGAAPINWAIINGEKRTGVTSFKLQHDIDTGNILIQKACEIKRDDTAGTLHNKLMQLGADVLIQTLNGILEGSLVETKQASIDVEALKHAPKIHSETCRVNWNKDAEEVYNFIRGLSPYPCAYSEIQSIRIKIFESEVVPIEQKLDPGVLISDGKDYLHIACKTGGIDLIEIQVAGKKRMNIVEFLRGYKQRLTFV